MIEIGRRVSVLYEGFLEDGTIFDSSKLHEGNPLVFVLGAGTVIPGLEKAVANMSIGEKNVVKIPAKDGYGEYSQELIQKVPRQNFPNADSLPIGEYIILEVDGERRRVKVVDIDQSTITLDFNHELSGHDLTFNLEVVDIFGESGDLIENELHSADCKCGCHKLKEQLSK